MRGLIVCLLTAVAIPNGQTEPSNVRGIQSRLVFQGRQLKESAVE
jgi:hypothetical protein